MDIEKVAAETPNKINTIKIDYKKEGPSEKEISEIISVFDFNKELKIQAKELIQSLYRILIEKDASLIEINLIITKKKNCYV